VKFWKKTKEGIDFVKTFKAHLGPIVKITASDDGSLLATISKDTTMKVYDVINFGEYSIIFGVVKRRRGEGKFYEK
jgi:peptidylprolyl isomerase domain and WD repeat-containing protein 1